MQLELKASSGNKKRILVGLSWEDGKTVSMAKTRDYLPPKSEPVSEDTKKTSFLSGLRNFTRHILLWGDEMASTGGQTFRALRLDATTSKKDDSKGRDIKSSMRDLDLLCFIFDKDKNFVREIGPDPDTMIDEASSVYHSGEEFSGGGLYDDEMVRIEIDKLPANYQHFVFVVVSDSKLSLAECGTFNLRLADSTTDHNFIKDDVDAPADNSSAYIFAKLSRDDQIWTTEQISKFGDFETDWPTALPEYI